MRNVVANGITTDASGNTYTTGSFLGAADFDPGPGTTTLTPTGYDAFIAKYDPNGNLIWTKNIPGSAVGAKFIKLDPSGNILIGGIFQGEVDFDPGVGTVTRTNASSEENTFVAKYDANGNYIWVNVVVGDQFARSTSEGMDIDAAGNVYLTGYIVGPVDFGAGFSFNSVGGEEVFIVKYSTGGNIVWARSMGGDQLDRGAAIAVDGDGDLYITGYFSSELMDFDPNPDNTAPLIGSGVEHNMFVAKYTANGNYVWVKQMGEANKCMGDKIALDAAGHLYVTGRFAVSVDMDPAASIATITSKGEEDVFLAKYDTSGRYIWAQGIGGSGFDEVMSVMYANSSVYVQGFFNDTVDFDSGPDTANLFAGAGQPVFIARYDLNGHYLWAGSFIGTGSNRGNGLCMDKSNNLYSAGQFRGTIDLDPGLLDANKTVSGRNALSLNAYIVKLNVGCRRFLAFTESACDSLVFNNVAYKTNGTYIDTFLTSAGCDSISTLHLAITGHTSVNIPVTAHYCDSVSLNGITYKTSGTYTQHYNNVTGCDSNLTYNLTIGQISATSSASYTACDSFVINDTLVFTSTSFRTVTFINASGCDSIVVLDITINPRPQAAVTRNGATLNAGGSGNYQWINCDGNTAIAGATAQQYTPVASGRYAVVVTSADCSDTSDCIEWNNTNAVQETGVYNNVNLYPNPATGQVTIRSKQPWNNATITLMNTIGQTLEEYANLKGNIITIDITRYPVGIYIIEISEANEAVRLKLTKQ